MFQRDYILRMIESVTNVMARFLLLKAQEKHQEALILLEEFYGRLMLPPSRLLLKMSDPELLSLASVGGEPDLDKTVSLAYLLKEEGRIHEDLEQHGESSLRFNKALFLFAVSALKGADVPGLDCREQIGELRELLRTYRIHATTLRLLMEYYEREGRYADAEDVLFELLESDPPSISDLHAGKRFFDRILTEPDESLESGNLPRHEAEQGALELFRRFGTLETADDR